MVSLVNSVYLSQLTKKDNFDNWSVQMRSLLRYQDVWDVVANDYEELVEDVEQIVVQVSALKKSWVKDQSACTY